MTLNSKQQPKEFMPVYDGRKAKIKGLWKRGDKYYAWLRMTGRAPVGAKPKMAEINSASSQKNLQMAPSKMISIMNSSSNSTTPNIIDAV